MQIYTNKVTPGIPSVNRYVVKAETRLLYSASFIMGLYMKKPADPQGTGRLSVLRSFTVSSMHTLQDDALRAQDILELFYISCRFQLARRHAFFNAQPPPRRRPPGR